MLFSKSIVGYEVDVAMRQSMVMEVQQTFHFKGTQRAAERKAMMKTGALRIIESRPLTDEEWARVYGIQQRM